MIHIDGSRGEGGGQVLRSSLALSLVTGKPFTIENIRAKRKKPGLMRQHLTAVEAAAKVGRCHVDAKVGTMKLTFEPEGIKAGNHVFSVGTAGSATLVFQTVLPALMLAKEPSTLKLQGGTHNPMAPPFDFLDKVFLPLVNRLGPKIEAKLMRYGFYPAGGGEFHVAIEPVKKLGNLTLLERGFMASLSARILLSKIPLHVAQRERGDLVTKTVLRGGNVVVENIDHSPGPGNAVMLLLESEHVTELFTGFGEIGLRAEKVAGKAIEKYRDYVKRDVPVGEFLADQLMLPLGIAAWQGAGTSEFLTVPLSGHSTTHIDILKQFLEIEIQTENLGRGRTLVRIGYTEGG
ncbi:MAG TPA: RNA 3'-terminal phosphate cyclase [Planctomycetaceae bacterium]|nr:RNA 3'-terminal phosphate cyclase [Planctomycetaceae bacterium]